MAGCVQEQFPVEPGRARVGGADSPARVDGDDCLQHGDDHCWSPGAVPGLGAVSWSRACSRIGMAAGSCREANSALTASACASSKYTATRSVEQLAGLEPGVAFAFHQHQAAPVQQPAHHRLVP